MWTDKTEARLLFATPQGVLRGMDAGTLDRRLALMGLDPVRVTAAPGRLSAVVQPGIRLTVTEVAVPMPLHLFRGITRPPEAEAARTDILRRLSGHTARIIVRAENQGGGRPVSVGLMRRLVWMLVGCLLTRSAPDLVLCPGRDRLMTADEAWTWLQHVEDRVPHFDPCGDVAHDRRKEMFLSDPVLSERARAWMEGPPEIDGHEGPAVGETVRAFLAHKPDAKRMSETAAGRSALYVMSATMMLFMLPLGASALTYNALSGGSFRLTAHAMAVTGLCQMGERLGVMDTLGRLPGLF